MLKFDKPQTVFEISGVKIGGQPGEYPTVLIGSIFYDQHKIVSNPAKGEFDRNQAEALIKKQEEMSDKTGNPIVIDVVGSTVEALKRYVDFASSICESPFLVDGPSASIRIPVIQHIAEVGLQNRAIYNSIDYNFKEDELKKILEYKIKSAVCLAHNPKNVWPEGRVDILRGTATQKGLLEAAKTAGIENILVDTAVLDVPSIGLAAKAIQFVKSELGLPAGCGPSNAISTWKKVKTDFGSFARDVCDAGADVATIFSGANFVLYGPIDRSERVFPACAMADAIVAYVARRYGIKPKVSTHPLFKIF
jgi:tetrahydromethanopterin S-methyltransferase subunit H